MYDPNKERPYSQKERELMEILSDALKRAAARWTPPAKKVEADDE
jgi:hypothetical protein